MVQVLQRLGAGTAGQVLQTGGAGANPSWTYNSTSQLTYRISVMNHGAMTAQIGYPSSHADTNNGYAGSGIMRLIAQEIA
jgi:hypothetical protein